MIGEMAARKATLNSQYEFRSHYLLERYLWLDNESLTDKVT